MKNYKLFPLLSLAVLYSFELAVDQGIDAHQIKHFYVLSNSTSLRLINMDISKFKILDTARLVITYNHIFTRDPTSGNREQTNMILEIGKRYTSFFSAVSFRNDSLKTVCDALNLRNPPDEDFSDDSRPTYLIFQDLQSKKITTIERIPFESAYVVEYTEQQNDFSWVITDSKTELLGYSCQLATTEYSGRVWNVWFTVDIPVSAGPWKFHGLPGLILRAEDSEHQFVFDAVGLSSKEKGIFQYLWPTKQMGKKQWKKIEQKLYTSPMQFVNQDGHTIFVDKTTQKWLDDSWSWPYNPIERE